jgi:hydroxyquinol 1,2-dioxygenase
MPYATEENLTDLAVERWKACHSERLRTIMQSLVKHMHGIVRGVELTREEWLFAANWLAKTGQLSNEKRQEFILLSDVLGISIG